MLRYAGVGCLLQFNHWNLQVSELDTTSPLLVWARSKILEPVSYLMSPHTTVSTRNLKLGSLTSSLVTWGRRVLSDFAHPLTTLSSKVCARAGSAASVISRRMWYVSMACWCNCCKLPVRRAPFNHVIHVSSLPMQVPFHCL